MNLGLALAAPDIFEYKDKLWVFHPLCFREWVFIDRVFDPEDVAKDIEVSLYALWLSARKEDPNIKRADVARELGDNPEIISKMMALVARISLPPPSRSDEEPEQETGNEQFIFQIFADLYNWSAMVVGDLTPAQISLHLELMGKGKGTRRGGIQARSLTEARKILGKMHKRR